MARPLLYVIQYFYQKPLQKIPETLLSMQPYAILQCVKVVFPKLKGFVTLPVGQLIELNTIALITNDVTDHV